ncbi:MAG: hypothetical protein GY808_09010 [Gammaproteobacteria bacterium]|nr:hypothetical protein [Gammaproteobacteria bacterium]
MQLPEVISYTKTSKGGVFNLDIDEQLSAFNGHFDDVPIVPGVVQIQWALAFANKYLDKITTLDIQCMDKLKFQKVILPNSRVILTLEIDDNSLKFSYVSELLKHSSGKIVTG